MKVETLAAESEAETKATETRTVAEDACIQARNRFGHAGHLTMVDTMAMADNQTCTRPWPTIRFLARVLVNARLDS